MWLGQTASSVGILQQHGTWSLYIPKEGASKRWKRNSLHPMKAAGARNDLRVSDYFISDITCRYP